MSTDRYGKGFQVVINFYLCIRVRWDILLDSLKYCQKNKDLEIYSYVFMLNHLHLIAKSPDMSGFVRDFKTFTSKEFRKNIEMTEPQLLKLFEDKGKYTFWQKTNMPKAITSDKFYFER